MITPVELKREPALGQGADQRSPHSTSPTDLANLDLLRSIAVTLVFVRHILQSSGDPHGAYFVPQALGIFGVMVFFVHTSLVLTMSLGRQGPSVSTLAGYREFLTRRVFRIYPLSVFVVVLTIVAFIGPGLDTTGYVLSAKNILGNLFLVQNIVGARSVIAPLWSLPVEIQMYLFLPPLFLALRHFGVQRFALVSLPIAIALGLARLKFQWLPELITFVPCFLPGMICYGLLNRSVKVLPFWVLPVSTFALLECYMLALTKFHGQFIFGYPVCLALGILIAYSRDIPSRYDLLRKASKAVATYSYGVYLFHGLALMVFFGPGAALPTTVKILLSVVTTAIASYAAYHLIEAPMVRLGARIASRFRTRETASAA